MRSCDFDKNNPARPVDWRWQQAAYLLRKRTVDRRCGDSWVQRALDYQVARQACRFQQDLEELGSRFPGFATAFDVWSAGQSVRKAIIESAILAKEPDAKVGQRLGLSRKTIEAYEAVFFSVRERLTCRGYIMAHAIGTKVYTGLSGKDFDVIMKMLAVHCGPGMIDLLLELYATELHVRGEGDAGPAPDDVMSSNIPVKIMLMTMIGGDTLEAFKTNLEVMVMDAKWKSGEIGTEEFDGWLDELLVDFKEAITAKPEPRSVVRLPDRQEVQVVGSARGQRRQSIARPGRA